MNNKKLINLILIILIPLVLIGLLVSNKNNVITSSDRKIIVESSYSNYAWGYTYQGMAICEDGTIYKWNMDSDYFNVKYSSENNYNLRDDSNRILKYSVKEERMVSNSDMIELKKNISKLKDDIDMHNVGNDIGSDAIIVWDYSKGKKITIKETGDFEGENNTREAQNIIRIINKYLY